MVTIDDQPWFVARDICEALELGWDKSNNVYAPSRLVKPLHDDEKASKQIATSGQKVILVSESGLYKLIMRSDKPQAKAFQDWVTKEVLPSIRKTGSFVTGHPSLVENLYPF
uniref:BRO, N-terminal n=1 Tax=Dechloromonas aromatica (strain RCB) TaxID=159087 RepID=Q47HX8_DECAR